MKELYIAPEAQLLRFVAQQKLASVEFDDLLAAASKEDGVTPSMEDIPLDII